MTGEHLKEKKEVKQENDVNSSQSRYLILYNDDHNTIDYVVETLIEVCKHTLEQAHQCTIIAHEKGKCDVKKGTYETIKPMKDGLINKGLTAEIS